MQRNLLSITIHKPVSDVFSFVIDPACTPQWIGHLVEEQVNEWPIRVGTIYRNRDKSGVWSEYTVSAFQQNILFELVASDNNYHVRYTFMPLHNGSTTMEYLEWVDTAQLSLPFTQFILDGLKTILEK